MTATKQDIEEVLKHVTNPMIRKLVVSLQRMPEYLKEKERFYYEQKEFRRKVFEKACRQAGLIK